MNGLLCNPKKIQIYTKYDEVGSNIFRRICKSPEYYIYRNEIELLTYVRVPNINTVVELGSGSSDKINILLKGNPNISTYIPVDNSALCVKDLAKNINVKFEEVGLKNIKNKLILFLGASICNLDPSGGIKFLKKMKENMGNEDLLGITIDFCKKKDMVIRMYNTDLSKKFQLNNLTVLNKEFGGNLDLNNFEYDVIWDSSKSCVNRYLKSKYNQTANFKDKEIYFEEGERIHVESSYKYGIDDFCNIMKTIGFIYKYSIQVNTVVFFLFANQN
jgi:uncharacterized SAM-dependent methyltransferase